MSRCRYLNNYRNTTEDRHICSFCSGIREYRTATTDGAKLRIMRSLSK